MQTGYDFILYKHGPFSFELRDSLAELSAEGLIDYIVRDPNYGPSVVLTDESSDFINRFPRTEKRFAKQIDFISNWVGSRGVTDLERLGTAVFVANHLEHIGPEERASEIVELKPHVSMLDAKEAVREAERLLDQSNALFKGST